MANVLDKNLGLAFGWALGEDNWNTGMDQNMAIIGGMASLTVLSATNTTPPTTNDGDVYFVPSGASGVWSGKDNNIAIYEGQRESAWLFVPVKAGWIFTIADDAQPFKPQTWNGSAFEDSVDLSGAMTPAGGVFTGPVEFQAATTFTGIHTANQDELGTLQDITDAIAGQDFSTFVKESGDYTLGGNITFSNTITGIDGVAASDLATVSQVDAAKAALTASNLGGFTNIFSAKVGDDFQFRTLQSSDASVTISQNANDIDLVVALPTVPTDFTDLNDTPANFSGESGRMLIVNGAESALEYADVPVSGVTDFVSLSDTPIDYSFGVGGILAINGTQDALEFVTPFSENFIDLADVPNIYTSQAGFLLRVNQTEDGVSFDNIAVPADFIDLEDTPSDYSGQATKICAVNGTEDGLEFIDQAAMGIDEFTELVDCPSTYFLSGGYAVVVNQAETGLEFVEFTAGLEVWTPTILQNPIIQDVDGGNATIVDNGNGNTLSTTDTDGTFGPIFITLTSNTINFDATERGFYVSPQTIENSGAGSSYFLAWSDGNQFTGTPPPTFSFGIGLTNIGVDQWQFSSLTGLDTSTSAVFTDAEIASGNIGISISTDGVDMTMNAYLNGSAGDLPVLTLVEDATILGMTNPFTQASFVGVISIPAAAVTTSINSVETPSVAYTAITQYASDVFIDPASYPASRTNKAFIIAGLGVEVNSDVGIVYDGVGVFFGADDEPKSRTSKRETIDPTGTTEYTGTSDFTGGAVNLEKETTLVDGNKFASISTNFTQINQSIDGSLTAEQGSKYIDYSSSGTSTLTMPDNTGNDSFEVDFYKALEAGATETDGYILDTDGAPWYINGISTGSSSYTPTQGEYVKAIKEQNDGIWHLVSFKTADGTGVWVQQTTAGTTIIDGDNLGNFAANNLGRQFVIQTANASLGDEFKVLNNLGTFAQTDFITINGTSSMQMSGRTLTNSLDIRSGQICKGVFDGVVWQIVIETDTTSTFREVSSIGNYEVGRNYYFDGSVTSGAVIISDNGGNAGQSSLVFFEAGGSTN